MTVPCERPTSRGGECGVHNRQIRDRYEVLAAETRQECLGEHRRSTYYHNKTNKIMMRTEAFDAEAEMILRQCR